jgi:hypothetical protein
MINLGLFSRAQMYNNEWIDYSKTYYKFKVGSTGLYRISQTSLTTIGLGNTPAEQFQLWRNGQQVSLFTSVATGPLGANDFIEFWGERNDGKPDKELYKNPAFQLSDKYSFQTDTAAFFLTVNPAGGNLRIQNTINDVAGNVLPAEPYFMHTEGKYFRDYINQGYFIDLGDYVYSSSYDSGENWVGYDIYPDNAYQNAHRIYLFPGGPAATFRIHLSGNATNERRYRVKINNDSIWGNEMNFLSYERAEVTGIPLSVLNSDSARIEIKNQGGYQYDRMVVSQYELVYPRLFNFGGTRNFEFELSANASGNYLEISNFNYGNTPPILYDITNGKRYTGNISNPALIKFALQPSAVKRKLILVSLDPSNITYANTFITKNFINFADASNQGDYLIITHPSLYNGAGGSNPIADYKTYRNSAAGGGYTTKVYEIDELVDQFAFGIKKHPSSIRNFLRWARATYSQLPKFVLLIGHAVVYNQYRYNESNPDIEKLNLVPTFGSPASDILLSAEIGQQIPLTPIGRLSAINAGEIADYLVKVKQYEKAQQTPSPTVQDKAWMKNVVHVVGGNNPILIAQLGSYFDKYNQIISDTLYGAKITSFKKSSAEEVEQLTNLQLENLFVEGISQITYFGHSSTTALAFNIDDPLQYNNQGKYPIFIAMGCLAGNFFNFNPARFIIKETISENFVFAKEKGSIAFLASSSYGIAQYLDIINTKTYISESRTHYGKSFGEILSESVIQTLNQLNNFYTRFHTEQNILHGDPAITPNSHLKPDYVIEDQLVKVSPSFISIAETSFKMDARFLNIGKAVNQDIAVEVKRQYPAGNIVSVYKDTIRGIRFQDSLTITLPINPATDKGLNKIIVSLDVDNAVDELFETNNSVSKDVFIFEDDIRPVYPLNFAIINKQNIKLQASTADALSPSKQYRMELDTTEFFNSPVKYAQTMTSIGGVLEFSPGVNFVDSTVYYWRVSPLNNQGVATKWNTSSFVYLSNSDLGFNQSHFFQHTKSFTERMRIDSASRSWLYKPVLKNLFIRTGIYPTASGYQYDYTISVNGNTLIGPGCNYDELMINVFDQVTFKPWQNDSTGTLYNSSNVLCGSQRIYNFHYFLYDTLWRRRAQNFLENIVPPGAYVVIRSNTSPTNSSNTYAAKWRADTAFFGKGNSLYHTLFNQGFNAIDQYDTTRSFIFVYKKNQQGLFTPKMTFSDGVYDRLLLDVELPITDTLGYSTSPVFGRAKQWKQLKWRGTSTDVIAGDAPTVDVIGIDNSGAEVRLLSDLALSQQDYDISSINAGQYPFLKLKIRNIDSINLTPYQLKYWRLTYVPVPEGALAPNILFQMKDTFEVGEPMDFKVAFKDVSEVNFDSLKVKMVLTNANNVATTIPLSKFRPLAAGDTLHVRYPFVSQNLAGLNSLFLDVNPDNDQPEQFHFNNFLYKNFFVKEDKINPLLDVTFDGVHILNRDIVSSKPNIVVKLKDESKWSVLNDTAGIKVQVRYPNGTLRPFFFVRNDTLKFTAAGSPPNSDNTATVDFAPSFLQDGDYELVVSGKDRSGNTAGNFEYKVGFQVINKPMISNMLNYPNPFTTSTAFVFTVTGSEVPQNIKIQVLTITGKIVREITKDELGPLHIGRNITEFRWDGTDQYGQKLANGIYLYRVVTNLNGRSLDKYKAEDDNTEKYFNKGYGKMYLMR